jgi:hypothetical protein
MVTLRKLARGRDDEGAHEAARALVEPVQDRQHKGRRLAGARLGQPDDVLPGHDRRNSLYLDGGRFGVAQRFDAGRNLGVKVKL